VFPVHGVGGIVGTFLAGILVSSDLGVFGGRGLAEGVRIGSQVGVQLVGIGVVALYTAILTIVLLKLVSVLTGGIRVSRDDEEQGLDIVDHDEKGYSL
jgi:Amt family ammonium transporter